MNKQTDRKKRSSCRSAYSSKQTDRKNASFAYSANMLRTLMDMKLITEDEYRKILQISAEHYGAEKIYV